MKVTIDRFEGDYAVCETGDMQSLNIPRSDLPNGAKVGDVLVVDEKNISIDEEETASRKEQIGNLMNDLFE